MDVLAVALAALFAVAAVAFVARPFLAEPEADEDRLAGLTRAEQERLELLEQRDRALGALKELEFDHRTGKITDEDYRALVQPLRLRAAETLGNGASLPNETPEHPSEQHFSARSLPSSRLDR
jgi:hypothetical protein